MLMANKRIRDLNLATALPADALFAYDKTGLTEAEAVGLGAIAKGASLVLVPNVVTDDQGKATGNSNAIQAALDEYAASGKKKGILLLPRGKVWIASGIKLTFEHSGLIIDGDGCTLLSENSIELITIGSATVGKEPIGYVDSVTPGSSPDELEFSPYDSTAYKAGDAVLLFKAENYIPNRQTVLQTAVIQSVVPGSPSVMTLDVPVTSGVDAAQFLYNGRKLAPGGVAIGATELTIPGEDATGLFPAGSWAFITDGVGVLATYGEYVRVLGADYNSTDTVLTIEGGVRNEYADDRAAVVPGRRADVSPRGWTEDVTVRGVTLGGTGAGVGSQVTQLSVKYCVDLKLERVRCALADPGLLNHGIIFITSGRVSVTDSEAVVDDGLRMNTCRDVVVERSRVKVSSEEFCTDLTFRDCDIVNAYAHVIGGERINAERCRFWNAGPGFANSFSDFGFRGCDFFVGDGAPVFYIQADRFTLKDVWSYGEHLLIVVQNGTGHVIDNVSATILLLDGTGGRITGPVYGTIRGDNMGTPLPIPGTWTRVALEQVSLALPTTVDDTAYVGKLSGLRSSIWARVSVTALGYGISIARQYLVGRGYSGSGAGTAACR